MATIILIPGLWETAAVWEPWAERYRALGHEAIAKSWPGMEGKTVDELRSDTTAYKHLGLRELVDDYAELAAALPTNPIFIGHSTGGAVVELLLDRGYGASGVAISPAP